MGCDTKHESEETLEAALEAVKYQDVDGLKRVHVEASEGSVYCAEDAMQRLWEKAGGVAKSGRCASLDEVSASEVDSAPDELRFLLQVVRFRCERPNATCSEYGGSALAEGARTSSLWQGNVESWTVRKRIGDDSQAVVYVDILVNGETVNRSVKLRRHKESWRVVSGLLEAR
jgi:hypothetical protein